MSLETILAAKAAANANKSSDTKQEPSDQPKEKAAHELALDKGMAIAKSLRLKRLVLKNGNIIKPTKEGYFIAMTQEIADQLEHYSSIWGMVEVIIPETKDKK